MRYLKGLVALASAVLCTAGHAEILQGVTPLDTLGDVRHKYPNATIVKVKAAWVTESDGFYSLSGQGFPGTLYIAFSDSRPFFKQLNDEATAKAAAAGASAPEPGWREMLQQGDDDALSVHWVRWIPERPIPIARYRAKYGQPTKCDFNASTMQPYCSWENRALLVALSDDQQNVLNAEAQFTVAETRAEWQARRHFIPDWLKEPAAKPPSKVTPAGKGDKTKNGV